MKIGIVTVTYPAALRYLSDFFKSLKKQDDQSFSLWIGLDNVSQKDVLDCSYENLEIHQLQITGGMSPTSIRSMITRDAASHSDAIVFVDSDDILMNTRLSSAKIHMKKYDVTATAMEYVDRDTVSIPGKFAPENADPSLVHNNCYGLTNTTWNAKILKKYCRHRKTVFSWTGT